MEMEKFAPSLALPASAGAAEHHLSYHGIINGDDFVVFRVEAQTIFMSISFIDILRITSLQTHQMLSMVFLHAHRTFQILDTLGWTPTNS